MSVIQKTEPILQQNRQFRFIIGAKLCGMLVQWSALAVMAVGTIQVVALAYFIGVYLLKSMNGNRWHVNKKRYILATILLNPTTIFWLLMVGIYIIFMCMSVWGNYCMCTNVCRLTNRTVAIMNIQYPCGCAALIFNIRHTTDSFQWGSEQHTRVSTLHSQPCSCS